MSDTIKKLTDLFADFPSVGPKTAQRFVFYLVKLPKKKVEELAEAIRELKNGVKLCSFCFNPHQLEGQLCPICQNPSRNRQLLCVVEKEADLNSIESAKKYQGLYFILGGNLLTEQKNSGSLRMESLKERVKNSKFEEIILATNPTLEGKATSVFIEKSLNEMASQLTNKFKITRLAKGLPAGGELEYADPETLESAFDGRK